VHDPSGQHREQLDPRRLCHGLDDNKDLAESPVPRDYTDNPAGLLTWRTAFVTVRARMSSKSADLYQLPPTAGRGRLLSYREAGERSGLGERYMQRLAQEGRIAVHRLSPRKVRIAEADLDEYIASCRREAFARDASARRRAS
jgi:excisionase family DNA binding protein